MKLSTPFLLAWTGFGVVVGAMAAQISTGFGLAFPATDSFMASALVIIGLACYAVTFPIYRYRRRVERSVGVSVQRPDPIRSFRLLVLSRAVIITALGFLGWHIGQLIWLWVFAGAPAGLVTPTSMGAVCSVLMYLGGLGAEFNCRAPKDSDGESK